MRLKIPVIDKACNADTFDIAIYSYLVFKINKIIPHNNLEVSKLPLKIVMYIEKKRAWIIDR